MRKEMIPLILLVLIWGNLKAQQNILVTNVNVISMRDSVITYKRSVLILDGKILSIKEVIKTDPKKVVVIDGGGAYMIPGLFDMHMHFYHDQGLDKKYRLKIHTK